MNPASRLSNVLLFLVGFASLGVIVTFLSYANRIFNAFLIALIIVLTVSPIMFNLKKRAAPTWVAFTVTLLVLLAVVLVFVLIVVGTGQQFIQALPEYTARAESSMASLESTFSAWGVERLGLDGGAIAGFFDPGGILEQTGRFIQGLIDTFSDLILVGALIVFMLVDATVVPSKMAAYLNSENPFFSRLHRYTYLIRRYIGITTIVGLVTGVLDTVLFSIIGVEFAILWGILAFLFSFIPTIGFWIAAIPPVILAYLQFGFPTALLVFLGIIIINGFAENIVKPRYMGIGLDLSFFTVFFSVIVWSAILGSMGAILAIPLTLAFKVLVLEGDEGGRWYYDLISDKKENDTSERSQSELE